MVEGSNLSQNVYYKTLDAADIMKRVLERQILHNWEMAHIAWESERSFFPLCPSYFLSLNPIKHRY